MSIESVKAELIATIKGNIAAAQELASKAQERMKTTNGAHFIVVVQGVPVAYDGKNAKASNLENATWMTEAEAYRIARMVQNGNNHTGTVRPILGAIEDAIAETRQALAMIEGVNIPKV